MTIDSSVKYSGPHVHFASITGSPLWGKSVEHVRAAWTGMGGTVKDELRPQTPYGVGPLVVHFQSQAGRDILWIPSYGTVAGEDFTADYCQEKLFWILWQAGVKVLLVGGTSGITDWREPEQAIQPGDLVLPWSFRTSPTHRGLPSTEYESFWPRLDVTMGQPFCPETAAIILKLARRYVGEGGIRKIHTPRDTRVALVIPDGITFESDFDILMWQAMARQISQSQPDLPPIATLHGDCINPLLARALGIHLSYYHMVANFAQGLGNKEIVETLYPLYLKNFAAVALPLEWEFLTTVDLPDGTNCSCVAGVHVAPKVFTEAMTQDAG